MTERSEIFNKIDFVDKLHISNHTDHNCLKFRHPKNYGDLKPINTMIYVSKLIFGLENINILPNI